MKSPLGHYEVGVKSQHVLDENLADLRPFVEFDAIDKFHQVHDLGLRDGPVGLDGHSEIEKSAVICRAQPACHIAAVPAAPVMAAALTVPSPGSSTRRGIPSP